MKSMAIKQHHFWERPYLALHFRGASAHIGLFELPRTNVSGHSGQTGASLDVGATLAESSGENIGLMSGICAFSLIVLVLVDGSRLLCIFQKVERESGEGSAVVLSWAGRAAAGAFVDRSGYFFAPPTHRTSAEETV